MANISELSAGAGDLAIHPDETGVEATARAAQRINLYGNQEAQDLTQTGERIGRGVASVGEAAVQYMEHREVSAGAAHGATLIAGLNQSWNDAAKNADPNDPSIAAKWRDQTLEPALDQFRQGFNTEGGQQWAEHFVDAYREHAVTKTQADMSSLAGDAVHVNTVQTINSLASATFNDPSTLNFSKDALAHSVNGLIGSSPNITADDAAKVKTELLEKGQEALVKSAVQGAILKGGNWKSIAEDPKNAPYIDQSETMQFVRQQQMYERMDQAETRNERVMTDYTNRQNFNSAADKLELSTLPQKAGDQPVLPNDYWDSVRKIGMQPGVDPQRLESLITKGQQITTQLGKPEPMAPISHATTMDLLGDLRSGKMATNDAIYKAYGDNKLNNADFNFLTSQYNEMKTPQGERLDKDRDLFFKRYQLSIDPDMGMDPKLTGRQPLYEAEMAARQKEADVRSKGGDPHSVYDPSSPNFFGKPDNLQRFRNREPLQTQMNNPQPGQPGTPNPTPTISSKADYDKLPAGSVFVGADGKQYRKP